MTLPAFQKIAVVDTFLGRVVSLHDTPEEAQLAIPRGAKPDAFRVEHGVCQFDPQPAPSAHPWQPTFF